MTIDLDFVWISVGESRTKVLICNAAELFRTAGRPNLCLRTSASVLCLPGPMPTLNPVNYTIILVKAFGII
jgi:hypothetical protein